MVWRISVLKTEGASPFLDASLSKPSNRETRPTVNDESNHGNSAGGTRNKNRYTNSTAVNMYESTMTDNELSHDCIISIPPSCVYANGEAGCRRATNQSRCQQDVKMLFLTELDNSGSYLVGCHRNHRAARRVAYIHYRTVHSSVAGVAYDVLQQRDQSRYGQNQPTHCDQLNAWKDDW